LRDVNLAIREGETVALLGPNGAGKTTMINVLLGLRRVDRGTVRVFGDPPLSARARQLIGMTQQESGFPGTLRVGEIVSYVAAQYRHAVPQAELLERFGLGDVERRQIGGLSGGQRRRLGVALAFAGGPRLVFLDEPTSGLDVESRRSVWDAIAASARAGATVLLTTHNLQEAEELASRAVVVSKGVVLADDSVAAIRANVRTRRVSVTSDVPLVGFANVIESRGRYSFVTLDADAAVRELVARNVPFRDLEVGPVSLEDAFLLIVAKTS
jgi:ABC-2 type transport system ATP-binding protein